MDLVSNTNLQNCFYDDASGFSPFPPELFRYRCLRIAESESIHSYVDDSKTSLTLEPNVMYPTNNGYYSSNFFINNATTPEDFSNRRTWDSSSSYLNESLDSYSKTFITNNILCDQNLSYETQRNARYPRYIVQLKSLHKTDLNKKLYHKEAEIDIDNEIEIFHSDLVDEPNEVKGTDSHDLIKKTPKNLKVVPESSSRKVSVTSNKYMHRDVHHLDSERLVDVQTGISSGCLNMQCVNRITSKIKRNHISNENKKNTEKATFVRPTVIFNNTDFISKTIEKNCKLQALVKKIIEVRAREKQRDAWKNYILGLKNKYGINNSDSVYSPKRFITHDLQPDILNYSHLRRYPATQLDPTSHLLNEFYSVDRTSMTKIYNRETQAKLMNSEKYSQCYPISSQGKFRMLQKDLDRFQTEKQSYHDRTRKTVIVATDGTCRMKSPKKWSSSGQRKHKSNDTQTDKQHVKVPYSDRDSETVTCEFDNASVPKKIAGQSNTFKNVYVATEHSCNHKNVSAAKHTASTDTDKSTNKIAYSSPYKCKTTSTVPSSTTTAEKSITNIKPQSPPKLHVVTGMNTSESVIKYRNAMPIRSKIMHVTESEANDEFIKKLLEIHKLEKETKANKPLGQIENKLDSLLQRVNSLLEGIRKNPPYNSHKCAVNVCAANRLCLEKSTNPKCKMDSCFAQKMQDKEWCDSGLSGEDGEPPPKFCRMSSCISTKPLTTQEKERHIWSKDHTATEQISKKIGGCPFSSCTNKSYGRECSTQKGAYKCNLPTCASYEPPPELPKPPPAEDSTKREIYTVKKTDNDNFTIIRVKGKPFGPLFVNQIADDEANFLLPLQLKSKIPDKIPKVDNDANLLTRNNESVAERTQETIKNYKDDNKEKSGQVTSLSPSAKTSAVPTTTELSTLPYETQRSSKLPASITPAESVQLSDHPITKLPTHPSLSDRPVNRLVETTTVTPPPQASFKSSEPSSTRTIASSDPAPTVLAPNRSSVTSMTHSSAKTSAVPTTTELSTLPYETQRSSKLPASITPAESVQLSDHPIAKLPIHPSLSDRPVNQLVATTTVTPPPQASFKSSEPSSTRKIASSDPAPTVLAPNRSSVTSMTHSLVLTNVAPPIQAPVRSTDSPLAQSEAPSVVSMAKPLSVQLPNLPIKRPTRESMPFVPSAASPSVMLPGSVGQYQKKSLVPSALPASIAAINQSAAVCGSKRDRSIMNPTSVPVAAKAKPVSAKSSKGNSKDQNQIEVQTQKSIKEELDEYFENLSEEDKGMLQKHYVVITDGNLNPYTNKAYLVINKTVSSLDDILNEEMDKSNQAKRDINKMLQCSVSNITIDIPTKDIATEITASMTDPRKRLSSDEISDSVRGMCIASVNTDPVSFLGLLKISRETISQMLSLMKFGLPMIPFPYRPSLPSTEDAGRFHCNICGKNFHKSTALTEHIESHELGSVRDCCVCRHLLDLRKRPKGMFPCRYCGQCFTRAYCCELHQQSCAKRLGKKHDVNESLTLLQ